MLDPGIPQVKKPPVASFPALIWIMEVNLETDETKLDQPFLTTR